MKEKKSGIAIEKFSEYVECLHQEADKGFEDQYTVCVVSKCVYRLFTNALSLHVTTCRPFPRLHSFHTLFQMYLITNSKIALEIFSLVRSSIAATV